MYISKRKLGLSLVAFILLTTSFPSINTSTTNINQIATPPEQKILAAKMTSIHMASNIEALDVLVNKSYVLPSKYVPENLVIANPKIVKYTITGKQERNHVRKEVAVPLAKMIQAAQKQKLDIWVSSAYRSFNRQKQIFNYNVSTAGLDKTLMVSARPGRSEHQTGLAIDFTTKSIGFSLVEAFADTKEGKWLQKHAHQYGFILRYPKGEEKTTGYQYEPWHFRYVGQEIAKEIYAQNITFEEYKNIKNHQ